MRAATRTLAFLLLALGLFVAPAAAQDDAADTSRIDRLSATLGEDADGDETGELEPVVLSPDILGEAGAEVQRQALTAYYQYRIDGYQHRSNVFRWQLLSSRIIFAMVILLVVAGVYFSWLQFRVALQREPVPGEPQETTTFEASTSGFKISSPILGVIILAISLAFFYLYLVHVYPIVEIF